MTTASERWADLSRSGNETPYPAPCNWPDAGRCGPCADNHGPARGPADSGTIAVDRSAACGRRHHGRADQTRQPRCAQPDCACPCDARPAKIWACTKGSASGVARRRSRHRKIRGRAGHGTGPVVGRKKDPCADLAAPCRTSRTKPAVAPPRRARLSICPHRQPVVGEFFLWNQSQRQHQQRADR